MADADADAYLERLTPVGVRTLGVLSALEAAQRRLHPPVLPELKQRLTPARDQLADALAGFRDAEVPEPLAGFHETFIEGAERTHKAIDQFVRPVPAEEAIMRVLGSMKTFSRALETFYGLIRFPPLSQYFLEESVRDRYMDFAVERTDGPAVGLQMSGGSDNPAGRGQFALYVPETYDGTRDLPLVVALHGGSGTGREFVWTWLREARSREFILLAPTSVGPTWALMGSDEDIASVSRMIDFASANYRIDRSKVLMTGLSDGATYTLLGGLTEDAPFTHLAPISGVMHPENEMNGNLARAKGRPIYLVHGALDWMFPVQTARMAAQQLEEAEAQLVYREIDDLSHTYPREENAAILEWFAPELALN
jgi:phospholipase/carboxylesterase